MGIKRISHFWIENSVVRYTQAGLGDVPFRLGEMLFHHRATVASQTRNGETEVTAERTALRSAWDRCLIDQNCFVIFEGLFGEP
jgi:hypothetical protein